MADTEHDDDKKASIFTVDEQDEFEEVVSDPDKKISIIEETVPKAKRHKFRPSASALHSPFSASDKIAKRVIAPYVNIIRKGHKATLRRVKECTFSFYLQKKPSLLIRTLNEFLSDAADIPTLLTETADVLKSLTKSQGVRLYMVDEMINEIYLQPKNVLNPRMKLSWPIAENTNVAAYVAFKKEYVMVSDVIMDTRFPDGLCYKDATAKAVLAVPVMMADDTCYAVFELYRDLSADAYYKDDLKCVVVVTGWMGAAIHQNLEKMAHVKKQQFGQFLSQLTVHYFEDNTNFDRWMFEMISFAKETLQAERSTFFLTEKVGEDFVADVYEEGITTGNSQLIKRSVKMHFNKDKSVHNYVARTLETVNIPNAYSDDRFQKEIDAKTGFITRSVLAAPIVGHNTLLGIFQLTNKAKDPSFTREDEEIIKVFSTYFALGLHYQRISQQHEHSKMIIANDRRLLKWHMRPSYMEINDFRDEVIIDYPTGFEEFDWYIFPQQLSLIPLFLYKMFAEVLEPDTVNFEQLKLFVLVVRKSYRNNPYHNFEHAFNVCHCMYNILMQNKDIFTQSEREALIVSALCHDIDHGGFTNNFLMLINDPLSGLYYESSWENHHYYVTMLILEQYKIFNDLVPENFSQFSAAVKEAILATDLALYFHCRIRMTPICQGGDFSWSNPSHSTMGKTILMTVCDLSGQCKKFSVAKRITDNLYREFYNQGDIETSMGLMPLSIMDREKDYKVPEDQVNFLQIIVIPSCEMLTKMLPNTMPLLLEAIYLKDTWKQIIGIRGQKTWKQFDSVLHSDEFV